MNIKIKTGFSVAVLLMASMASVYAEGSFLCMRTDESVAITADDEGNYKYIDMLTPDNTNIYPQISADGNTYLPLRFICEKSGLKDASGLDGELPNGYFRYIPIGQSRKQEIEIRYNDRYFHHVIGESFDYVVSENDIRNIAMYNIDGNIYVPMRYIAEITGATVEWQHNPAQIMFISKGLDRSDYITPDNHLLPAKTAALGFDYYNNNIGECPLYLKTDGHTVANLLDETYEASVRSVTRSGSAIYYINGNNRVMTKHEDESDSSEVSFKDETGNILDIYADTAIVIKNRIYGIETDVNHLECGRLFTSRLDGSDFRYLSDIPVFNLILKCNQLDYYLFYCEASNRSVLHMIEMKTMDDYTISVTDHSRNNMLNDIHQFAVGASNIFYIDGNRVLHCIDLDRMLEKIEIQRLDPDAHKLVLIAENGESLEGTETMNYDYKNDVLYVKKGTAVYYYTKKHKNFAKLYNAGSYFGSFSLFSDSSSRDLFAGSLGNAVFSAYIRYSDGDVNLLTGETL